MRIALVILHANAALGGAEVYTVNLARSLLERGHDVSLLAQDFGANLPPARQVPLPVSAMTRTGRYLAFLGSLNRHLQESEYDIVHAMLPVPRCDVYHLHSGLAAQGYREGYMRHGNPFARTLSRWAGPYNTKRRRFATVEHDLMCGPRPPVTLCLTDEMKASAARYVPANPDTLLRLYYGIDLHRFDPQVRPKARDEVRQRFGIGSDNVLALFVGQDFQRKGLRQAILAIAQADDPRLGLLVVGRDDASSYVRLAQSLGIADRIVFAGPTSDVYSFYQASDFLLFPTLVEPCGLVVWESAAMGKPVVVPRSAGAHELITDGREGVVVDDPLDVPALTGAVRRMLDPDQRRSMSQSALELRPRFSYEQHLDDLIKIYEQCTAKQTTTINSTAKTGAAGDPR